MKNKDLQIFYNKTFKKKERIRQTSEFEEVLKESSWKRKTVLEVGCGTGKFAYIIAKKGAKVLGVDYSKTAIEIAQRKYKHNNLTFKHLDITQQISGKYDVIVSIGTLEHFDKPFKMLRIFKKHLNKGGTIVITSPNWSNPRGYILICLYYLFNAPITLADLHYLTPVDFMNWATKLQLQLKWRTIEKSWAHGEQLINDLQRRIPKVLSDANLPNHKHRIKNFLTWLNEKIIPLNNSLSHSGAIGLYTFYNKSEIFQY